VKALLVLGLALPAWCGWHLSRWVFGPGAQGRFAGLGRVSVAFLVGVGLSSLTTFLWLVVGGALDPSFVVADSLLFACIGAGSELLNRKGSREPKSSVRMSDSARSQGTALDTLSASLLALGFALALWSLTDMSWEHLHGGWDAWAFLNQRARFLVRAGHGWKAAFGPDLAWSQVGYPLLLPLSVARAWTYVGETQAVPLVLGIAFTLSAAWVLVAGVATHAGCAAGSVAGLLLLGTPGFIVAGSYQYADVPLASLLVAALAALQSAGPARKPATIALGGALLGFAGWTKNEGILAGALAVATFWVLVARSAGIRAALRDLGWLAVGAAPSALVWLVFHVRIERSLMPGLPAGYVAPSLRDRILDPNRWAVAFREFSRLSPGMHIGVPCLAIGLAILLGVRSRALVVSIALWTGVGLWIGVAIFFALTPWPLEWHLRTAAERLALQPWPAILLGLFGSTRVDR